MRESIRHYEGKAKLRANIKACPYKGQPYTRCTTCECRALFLRKKKREQFWSWCENFHWSISTLNPAEECNTGR